jgi:hypothetical protein
MNIFERIDQSKDEHFERFNKADEGDMRMVVTKHSGFKHLDRFYDEHPDFRGT